MDRCGSRARSHLGRSRSAGVPEGPRRHAEPRRPGCGARRRGRVRTLLRAFAGARGARGPPAPVGSGRGRARRRCVARRAPGRVQHESSALGWGRAQSRGSLPRRFGPPRVVARRTRDDAGRRGGRWAAAGQTLQTGDGESW